MSTSWYVDHKGKTVGPISSAQLKQLASSSKISPDTKVRMGESGNWSQASKVKGLFTQIATSTNGTAQRNGVVAEAARDSTYPVAVASALQASVPSLKPCLFCGEDIAASAIKCRHCNEFLDGRPRVVTPPQHAVPQHAQPVVQVTQVVSNNLVGYYKPRKSKTVAILLAIFLGGLGLHHFYMGHAFRGLLYLLFCWTLIPALIALLEAVTYALSSDASFQASCN